MPSTPIPPGSVVYLNWTDPADTSPEAPIEAFLVMPNEDLSKEEVWVNLGNSFGADTQQHFIWMVAAMAAFHNLNIQNETGVTG